MMFYKVNDLRRWVLNAVREEKGWMVELHDIYNVPTKSAIFIPDEVLMPALRTMLSSVLADTMAKPTP